MIPDHVKSLVKEVRFWFTFKACGETEGEVKLGAIPSRELFPVEGDMRLGNIYITQTRPVDNS